MGFADDKKPAALARVLAGGILASSLLTRAEWGAAKVLPFKAHLAADTAVGLLALGAPWLFGFAGDTRARNTFLAMGALGTMAGLLSQPEEMPSHATDSHHMASGATTADAPVPQEA